MTMETTRWFGRELPNQQELFGEFCELYQGLPSGPVSAEFLTRLNEACDVYDADFWFVKNKTDQDIFINLRFRNVPLIDLTINKPVGTTPEITYFGQVVKADTYDISIRFTSASAEFMTYGSHSCGSPSPHISGNGVCFGGASIGRPYQVIKNEKNVPCVNEIDIAMLVGNMKAHARSYSPRTSPFRSYSSHFSNKPSNVLSGGSQVVAWGLLFANTNRGDSYEDFYCEDNAAVMKVLKVFKGLFGYSEVDAMIAAQNAGILYSQNYVGYMDSMLEKLFKEFFESRIVKTTLHDLSSSDICLLNNTVKGCVEEFMDSKYASKTGTVKVTDVLETVRFMKSMISYCDVTIKNGSKEKIGNCDWFNRNQNEDSLFYETGPSNYMVGPDGEQMTVKVIKTKKNYEPSDFLNNEKEETTSESKAGKVYIGDVSILRYEGGPASGFSGFRKECALGQTGFKNYLSHVYKRYEALQWIKDYSRRHVTGDGKSVPALVQKTLFSRMVGDTLLETPHVQKAISAIQAYAKECIRARSSGYSGVFSYKNKGRKNGSGIELVPNQGHSIDTLF
jgi:hypothetical protein